MNLSKQSENMRKEFRLKSTPDSIYDVERIIEDYSSKLKFKEDAFGNIMVAVTEAVNNAILHGNGSNPDKEVTISLDLPKPFRFIVTVIDEGNGFDIDNLPDPTAPENIEKEGGRGIFLMKMLADEIAFDKGGTEIRMTFLV